MPIYIKHAVKWTPDTERKIHPGTTVMVTGVREPGEHEAPHGQGTLWICDDDVHYHIKGRFDRGVCVRGKITMKNPSSGRIICESKGTFNDEYFPTQLHGPKCEYIQHDWADREEWHMGKGSYKGAFHMGVPIMGTFTGADGTEYNLAEGSSYLTWDEAKREYGETMAKKVLRAVRDFNPESKLARTAPGGAAEGMVESEAESEAESVTECDDDDAPLELWPWQESAIAVIKGTTSNRTIHWFHSTEGNVGKTQGVGAYLYRYMGAVLLKPAEFNDAKHLIAKKMEATHGKFREWPIVIIDLPRANTELVRSSKLYVLIEEVQNLFSASDRQFIIPPTVVVFANEPPATKMMSPDRFQVQKVDDAGAGKLYLHKDYATHEKLKQFAQELRERNERERKLIEDAKVRAEAESSSFDVKVEFSKAYQLGDQRNVQNKRKSIPVAEMLNKCQRVFGDNNPFTTRQQLETFIDETYDFMNVDECGGSHNPQPPAGKIVKVAPKNVTKYIGFKDA